MRSITEVYSDRCTLTWLIEPLRAVWPMLRQLPVPIQIGIALAAAGLLLLLGTLIWERIDERERDRELRDDP